MYKGQTYPCMSIDLRSSHWRIFLMLWVRRVVKPGVRPVEGTRFGETAADEESVPTINSLE